MIDQPQFIRQPIPTPPPHIAYAHKFGRGMLTFEQIEELVKSINPAYVDQANKKNYLAQHQARAEMNRIFGYGNWDMESGEPTLLYEYTAKGSGNNANKDYWFVGYRIRTKITIRDLWGMPVATFTGTHAEENAPQPNRGEAHALALTSVDSYAMRRALINLGDRFGLGLYDGGKVEQHGRYTIQLDPGAHFVWAPSGAVPQPSPSVAAAAASVGVMLPPPPAAPATADAAMSALQGPAQDFALTQPPIPRPPVDERFPQAFAQVQESNAAARAQAAQGGYPVPPQQEQAPNIPAGATDALKARMQAQMKVDQPAESFQQYDNGDH